MPNIFKLIKESAKLSMDEMLRTFNCGIGMAIIVKKSDARPFKASDGITMMVVDPLSGEKAKFSSKDTIIESYKKGNEKFNKKQFTGINDGLNTSNILRFY